MSRLEEITKRVLEEVGKSNLNIKLPHHKGFYVLSRAGDEFEYDDSIFKIKSHQIGSFGGGNVKCELSNGKLPSDSTANPDGSYDFCADSVALFLYEGLKRKAESGDEYSKVRLRMQDERAITVFLRAGRFDDAAALADKHGDALRANIYRSLEK